MKLLHKLVFVFIGTVCVMNAVCVMGIDYFNGGPSGVIEKVGASYMVSIDIFDAKNSNFRLKETIVLRAYSDVNYAGGPGYCLPTTGTNAVFLYFSLRNDRVQLGYREHTVADCSNAGVNQNEKTTIDPNVVYQYATGSSWLIYDIQRM
jgi:hypothetical protein